MKLLAKINRRFLVTATVLLAVCSLLLFFMMRYVIQSDADENLEDEKQQIITEFESDGQLPAGHNLKSDRVQVQKVSSDYQIASTLSDTLIFFPLEQEYIPHRQLPFLISDSRGKYLVTISQSQLEPDDLFTTLMIFTLIFIAALLSVIYFFNRHISKSIWQPFNVTLEKLKTFDLTGLNQVSFSHSGIIEFEELNQSLNKMTEKIYSDYHRLKQFTENASHEMQTPLAVIRSKVEILIQSESLGEEQSNSIQKINEAVSKLSRLNSALLTLTKIENRQFADGEEIYLAAFIRNKLTDLEELIQQRRITVSIDADEKLTVKMNPALADLLIDNLIGNALKHNVKEGFIKISLRDNRFTISNSGEPLQVLPEKLFDRFARNDPSSDSLGLGLAMVKEICMMQNFKIEFDSDKNIHRISICF